MTRESMRVSVTYDVVTEESVADGDTTDNGYIQPGTEARRSFSNGRKRDIERNMRMSRAGKFDWTLRDALAFIDSQNCATLEGQWTGVHDNSLRVYASGSYDEQAYGGPRESFSLHLTPVSYGSCDRLQRLLASKGVRFYLTNGGRLVERACEVCRKSHSHLYATGTTYVHAECR
jgi:hypothetical protein